MSTYKAVIFDWAEDDVEKLYSLFEEKLLGILDQFAEVKPYVLETIEELNIAGYMVTMLATTGGFLKNKNTTIMIVADDEKVAEALKIIKKNSGERKTITYANPALISGQSSMSAAPSVPINVQVGGSTIFVLNVEQMEKY